MIFLKKIHGNMTFSSKFLKRWSFQKGPRRDMIFLVLSGKMVFFSPKTWYFFLGQEVRDNLSQEIIEIWYFQCSRTGVTNVVSRPSAKKKKKKNQRWSYPAKIHQKEIGVLDWHPRKSSSNSLYFHGDLYRRFHALLSSEKKQET